MDGGGGANIVKNSPRWASHLEGVLSLAPVNWWFKDRQIDRRIMDKTTRSSSCEVKKKTHFNKQKFVVQIKHAKFKGVIIQSFRSKKLPKILQIRPIRDIRNLP